MLPGLGILNLQSYKEGRGKMQTIESYQKLLDEAYVKGNVDALDDTHAPDIVMHELNSPGIIGLDALKGRVRWLRQIFSECRIIVDELLVTEDRIVSRWTLQGIYSGEINTKFIFQSKGTGESQVVKTSVPAGAQFSMAGCGFARLVNGKIVEEWSYWDSLPPSLSAAGVELKTERE
jgi:hypothetical protein